MGNAGGKWLVPVLFLFLLMTLSTGNYGGPCTLCKMTEIYMSANGSTINAALIATTIDLPDGRTEEEKEMLQQVYEQALHEDYVIPVRESGQTANVALLANQPIYFSYDAYSYDPAKGAVVATRTQIFGCYPVMTNENGMAACTPDYSVYRGRCAYIYAAYRGNSQYNPASRFVSVCDKDANGFSAMASSLSGLSLDQPLCLLGTIILGLLIASMFFTGRSPLMLLDITTPLLPKPKSISFSGLSFGTGYVRMMKELQQAQKLTASHLGLQAQQLRREMLRNGFSSVDIDRIMRLAKDNPAMAYLALRALRDGKAMSEVMRIAGLMGPGAAKDNKLMDQDLEAAAKAIREMEKAGKDAGLDAVWLNINSKLQAQHLGKIVGDLTPRQAKIRGLLVDNTLMKILMPERIRDQLKVGVGSAFFGIKSARDVTKEVAKSTVRTTAVAIGAAMGRKVTMFEPKGREAEARQVYVMDIRSRISQAYAVQLQEAKANAAMYLVKKMLEGKGVRIGLTEKDLLGLGKIEILSKMGLKGNAAASGLDKKIRGILSMSASLDEKISLLMALADSEKSPYDRAGLTGFINRISAIDSNKALSDHGKMQELHNFLRDHNRDNPLNSDRFYTWAGRDSLRITSEGKTKFDDTWAFLFLREFLEQNSGGKAAPLSDVAKLQWVRLVNEMWGLLPSNTKGLQDGNRQTMKRAEDYLLSMLSKEGLNFLADAKNRMKSVFELLYDPAVAKAGLFYGNEGAREYGANPNHWKLDIRGYWRAYVPGSEYLRTDVIAKTSVMEQAHGAIFRAHTAHPFISEIRKSDPTLKPDQVLERAREMVAAQMFYNRIRGMVGSRYPDAYYTANSEYAFLNSVYGSYRERFAQMNGRTEGQRKDYSWVTDKDVEKLIKKGISFDDINKFVWIKTREGSFIPFTEGREGMALRASDGETVINGRLSVNIGGRWTEFKPSAINEKMKEAGNQLSDALAKERVEIMNELAKAPRVAEGMIPRRELSPELQARIDQFGRGLKAWAGNSRQDIAALVLLNLCKETRYFKPLEESKMISIRPVKDTDFIGFNRFSQKIAQPFSKGIQSALVSSFLPQINDIQNFVMHSEYYRARAAEFSYRVSADPAYADPHSKLGDPRISGELKRNASEMMENFSRYRAVWDMSITRDPRGNSSALGPQANFASMYHHGPGLHPVPGAVLGQFTGHNFGKMMESFRLLPLSVNWMLGAPMILMTRGAMTSWLGYPSKHDKTYNPLQPYQMTSSRTLEGFRALFDPFYAALDFSSGSFKKVGGMMASPLQTAISPLRYTLESLQKAVDYVAPAHTTTTGNKGIFQRASEFLGKPEGWMSDTRPEFYLPYYAKEQGLRERLTGPMTMREYGGKSVQDGMVRTHEDHAWIYKNMNVIWNMNTNPGISYVDFYYNVRADPRLASHLVSGSPYKSFFAQDEYLQKQANMGMVHREASPYELAAMREDELRSYNTLRGNRMLGLINPLFFFVNNPLPVFSYLSYYGVKSKWEKGKEVLAEMEERKKARYADLSKPPTTMFYGTPVSQASHPLTYTTLQPSEAAKAQNLPERFIKRTGQIFSSLFADTQYMSCSGCGSPMQRGGVCPVCSGKSLYLLRLQKWARYGGRRPPAARGTP